MIVVKVVPGGFLWVVVIIRLDRFCQQSPDRIVMDWIYHHALQLGFLGCYLAMLAYHAWRGGRQSRTLDDYLVGGRKMGGVVTALSFYATFVSSVTFIGHAGRSYTLGPTWWLTCVIVFTAMVLVAWFVVAPPLVRQARRFQALTIPDFLGHRYRSLRLRRCAGVVVVVASLVYMVAVFDGAARSLDSLLQLDSSWITMAVIFVVVTGILRWPSRSVAGHVPGPTAVESRTVDVCPGRCDCGARGTSRLCRPDAYGICDPPPGS